MKPQLEYNFSVSVRHQVWEEPPEVAKLYQGIYSVTLNFLVEVMFVPEFKRNLDKWPPAIPEDIDDISTEFEARLFTAMLSDYTVTPDSSLAGQQEIISLPSHNEEIENSDEASEAGVLFYVSPQEFTTFSKELAELSEKILGVHDYIRLSEIENLEFVKFLLYCAINSQQLSTKHLRILQRENAIAPLP